MRNNKPFKVVKKPSTDNSDSRSVADIVKALTQGGPPKSDYRAKSLKIHGLICAKCGREFEPDNLTLLTVHHKDGDHQNNPPDGSNWENLCVHCHDDEHSRGMF
ncbi:MAG: HNH nuclease family protein [Nitrospira sp.]|nr:HNH nuclease family protein [bacterium]MBL7048308.1 HNH nuclease family protein [Nitrospira sp.]